MVEVPAAEPGLGCWVHPIKQGQHVFLMHIQDLNLEQDALLFLDTQAPHAVLARAVALGPVGKEDYIIWL